MNSTGSDHLGSLPEYYNTRAANRHAHELYEDIIKVAIADKPHFDAGHREMMKALASGILPSMLSAAGGLSPHWGLIVGGPAALYYIARFLAASEPREALTQQRNTLVTGFNTLKKTIRDEVPDAKWNDEQMQFTSRRHPEMLDFSTLPPPHELRRNP